MSERILTQTCIQALTPYASARRTSKGGDIWLNANESPFNDAYDCGDMTLNQYPQCQPAALVAAYADYAKVTAEQVLCSRGADEAIELLIRAYCQPGKDKILICPPTYGMYAISAQTAGVDVIEVPTLADSFQLDVDAIIARLTECKVVFICAPNNPTGTDIARKDILDIIKQARGKALVVIDEAYIEFSPSQSFAADVDRFDNLVVLRTLSKAFALAGLRCGFALANKYIIQDLLKVIAPYPISVPVATIAEQALSPKNVDIMRTRVESLNRSKAEFSQKLLSLPLVQTQFTSAANFILLRSHLAKYILESLAAQGIVLRDQSNQRDLQDCLRISIGTASQLEAVFRALQQIQEQQS